MNILIVEQEIYLAQKVAIRLQDDGYHCTHLTDIKEINFNLPYETILLSTNLSSAAVKKIITSYPNAIVILLVSYVNDTTVSKPLKDGAKDYIVKPFIMDELIRKIEHYKEYKRLQHQNNNLNSYIEFAFNNVTYDINIPKTLPFIIETNDQKLSSKIAFDVAKKLNKPIKFISLEHHTKIEPSDFRDELLYIYDFHFLKNSSKMIILNTIKDFDVIVSSIDSVSQELYPQISVKSTNKMSNVDAILTINDYVKMIVTTFQNKYPDTELSKKLGISRKSLWEKRKKFGIEKIK